MLPTSLWICIDNSATALTAAPADRPSTSASILLLTDLQKTQLLERSSTGLDLPVIFPCCACSAIRCVLCSCSYNILIRHLS